MNHRGMGNYKSVVMSKNGSATLLLISFDKNKQNLKETQIY